MFWGCFSFFVFTVVKERNKKHNTLNIILKTKYAETPMYVIISVKDNMFVHFLFFFKLSLNFGLYSSKRRSVFETTRGFESPANY